MSQVPITRSYWVEAGRFLAGAFPGHPDDAEAAERIRALLDGGIRTFVNLMFDHETGHDGELFNPYAPIVEREAQRLGIDARCHRLPIVDVSIPTLERMDEIQETLREALAREAPVYVHCWGGRGRTGQVVGVHLIARGLATQEDFVEHIEELRIDDEGGGPSPETDEQIDFVKDYVRERNLEASYAKGIE